MQKGIKFRIYPNREQQNLINQTLGCCRLIYNKGLAMRNEAYKNGKKIGYPQTSAMLTERKKCEDFAFLKVADSIALQQSLRDLDRGFVNFFQKRAAHPAFKRKHNCHQSYRTVMLVLKSFTLTVTEMLCQILNILKNQCVNSFVNSVSCQENRKALITVTNSVLKLP